MAETGLEFSFIFALYEGASGNAANADDCSAYAEHIGSPSFPVMSDGLERATDVTPMTLDGHPEMCALAPDMTILGCHMGHGAYEYAWDDIRAHAGL
jgi:hypothetical protein